MKINKIIKNRLPDRALGSQIESKALSGAGGYAILELLFYITFFSILTLVVINAMVTMTRSFRETTIQRELVQSGTIMERMSREIRQAYGISSISTSNLVLNTTDSDGANKTVEFKFISPNIQFWDAGINMGNLNSSNIVVTDLAFTQITTIKGQAVKIILSIRSGNDSLARVVDFYDTVVLRGGY